MRARIEEKKTRTLSLPRMKKFIIKTTDATVSYSRRLGSNKRAHSDKGCHRDLGWKAVVNSVLYSQRLHHMFINSKNLKMNVVRVNAFIRTRLHASIIPFHT